MIFSAKKHQNSPRKHKKIGEKNRISFLWFFLKKMNSKPKFSKKNARTRCRLVAKTKNLAEFTKIRAKLLTLTLLNHGERVFFYFFGI
jgi:hypothetical protein